MVASPQVGATREGVGRRGIPHFLGCKSDAAQRREWFVTTALPASGVARTDELERQDTCAAVATVTRRWAHVC
jgi:hypothetical protein